MAKKLSLVDSYIFDNLKHLDFAEKGTINHSMRLVMRKYITIYICRLKPCGLRISGSKEERAIASSGIKVKTNGHSIN